METAKVDIRKLQLLNDRINQTIEALNQVRLSVHGISHSSPFQGQIPQMQGQVPFGNVGINPYFGAYGVMQQPMVPGYNPGFSHSSPWGAVNPFLGQVNPMLAQVNPLLAQVNPLLAQQVWAAAQQQ